jgi:hypothetical protein
LTRCSISGITATSSTGQSNSLLNCRFRVRITGGRPTQKEYPMEIWKNCVDYPDLFEVSNLGNFRNKRNKKELKQWLHPHGYLHVATKIGGRKGKNVCFKVHREVAKAFIPNPDNLPVVNHMDGVKTNNCLLNLEWVSVSGNAIHATRRGLNKVPINPFKLTEEQQGWVRESYRPRDREFGARALGRLFGVCHTTVLRVLKQ